MAATHDVYFGTVFTDVNTASRSNPMGLLVSQGQTAATYDPPACSSSARPITWRVDEAIRRPIHDLSRATFRTFTVEPFAYPR
jgi:hypothetical protein